MNTTAAKFVNRNRNALTVVNLLLVLAVFQQLHGLLLHQTGRTNLVCTLPSILTVGSTALGMALVIGLNQLRPSWLALSLIHI